MAKGYRSGGVDFDDLFDPDVVGDGPSVPNARSGGVPLRYAALAYGTKRADVGYRQGGVDVSNLWAQRGSAVYSLPFNGLNYRGAVAAPTGSTGIITASRSISIYADGTWGIPGSGNLINGGPTSGTWVPAGQSPSDWDVQFVGNPDWTIGEEFGSSSNGAPNYVPASTPRTYTISGTVNSATAQNCSGLVRVVVNLRNRVTGQSIISTILLQISATGWV